MGVVEDIPAENALSYTLLSHWPSSSPRYLSPSFFGELSSRLMLMLGFPGPEGALCQDVFPSAFFLCLSCSLSIQCGYLRVWVIWNLMCSASRGRQHM